MTSETQQAVDLQPNNNNLAHFLTSDFQIPTLPAQISHVSPEAPNSKRSKRVTPPTFCQGNPFLAFDFRTHPGAYQSNGFTMIPGPDGRSVAAPTFDNFQKMMFDHQQLTQKHHLQERRIAKYEEDQNKEKEKIIKLHETVQEKQAEIQKLNEKIRVLERNEQRFERKMNEMKLEHTRQTNYILGWRVGQQTAGLPVRMPIPIDIPSLAPIVE